MSDRFTQAQVEAWRRDGGVLIPGFFTAEEVSAVVADFETVFGPSRASRAAMVKVPEGQVGAFNPAQFKTLEIMPLDCSPALNLIGVHPSLIAFARAALRSDEVYLYQCQAWAKFTGEADYDQPFHCDFVNHTLTVPSEHGHPDVVTILCYFTDVGEGHGPMHYVARPDSDPIAGPEGTLGGPEAQAVLQQRLAPLARSSAGPAGSIFPYGIDVYHRGTNLTAPGGHRYAVMSCFKRCRDDTIGFTAWPFHHMRPWHRIFDHATPEQLACFGVQPPGHPFWTQTTLARAQARYPNWDLAPYRAAMAKADAAA